MEQVERLTPTGEADRISAIDVLRGIALFGILTANMRGFFSPGAAYFNMRALYPGHADVIAQNIVNYVFQGKFITLFSILFGIGFAIQMDRVRAKGRPDRFYLRRLAWLAVFGLVHGLLIWWGDILFAYALTGVLVYLFFRNGTQKTIAIWAIALFVGPLIGQAGYLLYRMVTGAPPEAGPDNVETTKRLQELVRIYATGSFGAVMKARWQDWYAFNHNPMLLFTMLLPRFLFGLWLWRSGFLKNLYERKAALIRVLKGSLAIAVLCDLVMLLVQFGFPQTGLTPLSYLVNVSRSIGALTTAIFYGAGIFLLLQSSKWGARLEPFAAVGRMALTNYLMQSLLLTWFFRLSGLYGQVGPAWGFVPTISLFGLQILFSAWWLQHYHFGPVEWLWRSLTYGSRQPMRRLDQRLSVAI